MSVIKTRNNRELKVVDSGVENLGSKPVKENVWEGTAGFAINLAVIFDFFNYIHLLS